MENRDRQISDKVNAYRIGDFDPDAGWAQLEQRLYPRKKRILSWRYAAAACLIACIAGAFLYSNHSGKTAHRAGLAAVRLMNNTLPAMVNDGSLHPPVPPEKTGIQQQFRSHAPVAKPSYTRMQPVVEKSVPLHTGPAIATGTTDPQKPEPVTAAVTPAASAGKPSGQLPVLTEEAFEAVVNPGKPRSEKQKRFLKYLAARARQTDYTGEKLSSSSTIVKF
ncbi:hypothetical protein LQ567_01820 [Niabella pedocola]|uniref:Uncharacterized protein n=1 Tax=Niabella pedocola TaxID=1752077 RepID=A0ABS8PK57_9BACT|nr:hypothetical protein [Niabella pedocola]MCD2421481.1 hypothetical protein [Niabella pedocola]